MIWMTKKLLKIQNHQVIIYTTSSNIIGPPPNKSYAPSDNFAPSKEVEKRSETLDDIEVPVVTIRRKDLDNKIEKENNNKYKFQGKSAILKCWFDLDHEWLEEMFCKREPNLYKQLYKMNNEGQEMETYQIFVFLMGNTKASEVIYLQARDNSVTPCNPPTTV